MIRSIPIAVSSGSLYPLPNLRQITVELSNPRDSEITDSIGFLSSVMI